MSTASGAKFPLKVVINKEKTKVLFAEADNVVADVLLGFLLLPLGKIVRILEKHYYFNEAPVIGSLTTLYKGLSNLDSSHFCVEGAKQMLLNPRRSIEAEKCRRVTLDYTDSLNLTYYICQDLKCGKSQADNMSLYSNIATCDCGKPLNREFLGSLHNPLDDDAGVFIMKTASFVICDDLRVVPVVSGFLQTLNSLGITDTNGAEERSLRLGMDDIMDLFKFSLTSATPLTDLIIKKTSLAAKPELGILLHGDSIQRGDTRKIILKVFLQKWTNKFLLAEATDEFVEFLFSFLALPLGGVEYIFGGKTSFTNIDNLYRSVTDVIDIKYFRTPETKNWLINPKISHGCTSKGNFLPLTEEMPPAIRLRPGTIVSSFKSSKGLRNFVKEETRYIVCDNLTVTPFSITSSISIPNTMGISLSDVKEMDLQIGMEEALRILKASLTSTTVLTDALINPMLNKLPKLPKREV